MSVRCGGEPRRGPRVPLQACMWRGPCSACSRPRVSTLEEAVEASPRARSSAGSRSRVVPPLAKMSSFLLPI